MAHGYDDELRRHNEILRAAAAVQSPERVLDIGCGTGLTTRQAARAADPGSVLGIDISEAALARARELATGIGNVAFERADAASHEFPRARFDVVISRFGTMFFGEPVAAFANIGSALRPGGRLAMLVWQSHERNAWSVALQDALGGDGRSDAFSLADPSTVERILAGAGFVDVALVDVREPVFFGSGVEEALGWVRRFSCTSETLRRLGPGAAERAVERLRRTLADHRDDDGVRFDSRAWLVTARRGRADP